MGETKSSNGVSGKKVVKKERVSKLGSYTDEFEFTATEFYPDPERINEKNGDSAGTGSSDATEGTTGKKEQATKQSSYIQTGNNIRRDFDPKALEAEKLEMKIKGKEKKKEQEQEQGQEKE